MNGFRKLVLCTAIMAASGSAMAMQAMDDETLSSTAGQDGITLTIQSSTITDLDITYVDRGGFGATFNNDGAVVVNNIGTSITNLQIVVDAGSDAGGNGQLNVDISTPDDIVVNLNGSFVEVAAGGVGSATSGNRTILKFGAASELRMTGGLNANLKLGNRGAGEDFMTLSVTNPFDITVNDFVIVDSVSGGNDIGIGVGALTVNDVDLNMSVNVVASGLQIDNAGTTIGEIGLERVKLGEQIAANNPIGDIYLNGLTANSVMTIQGH